MGMQLIQQINFICVNMTINETMNAPRYVHFWTPEKQFVNPFDRGSVIANIKDWWNPVVNWYSTYRVDQLHPDLSFPLTGVHVVS